jgi:hypothetical protein
MQPSSSESSSSASLRTPPEPAVPPVKEPPGEPEDPHAPVQEPDLDPNRERLRYESLGVASVESLLLGFKLGQPKRLISDTWRPGEDRHGGRDVRAEMAGLTSLVKTLTGLAVHFVSGHSRTLAPGLPPAYNS